MGDSLIGWAFNFVPVTSVDFTRQPDWSPDVYNSIVWDYSLYLDFSFKLDFTLEFGHMIYTKLEFNVVLAKGGVGMQAIVMEEWPTHMCNLFYSDLHLLETTATYETNSKACKANLTPIDNLSLHMNHNISPEFDFYAIEETFAAK